MIILPQARGVLGVGHGWSPGPLIVELLFETGGGNPTNTGTLGGTFTFGDFGTGFPPTNQASGGIGGSAYIRFPNPFNSKGAVAKNGAGASYIIGTADFEISAYLRFTTYTVQFFQEFWSWSNGSSGPRLVMEKDTGALYFKDGTISDVAIGYTPPLDSTWRKYALRRRSGVVYFLLDNVELWSMAYASDCNSGFSGDFYIGVTFNGGGGLRNADMDEFRFYNGNV